MNIREAIKSDTGLILSFIRKKAVFDGVPHWVEATEDRLAAELFSARSPRHLFCLQKLTESPSVLRFIF